MSDSLKQIESKVTEIKILLERHTVAYEKDSAHFKERLQEHTFDLYGKGENDGIKTDVDRLKTQAGMIKWIGCAISTLIVERFYSWFGGKH